MGILKFEQYSFTVQLSILKMQTECQTAYTVNFRNIRTPKKFVVITLKFELCGSTTE